ncbi:protein-glutamate O-methyltransferase CheR [Massilia sp. H6]|uniref:CheR family methyltransferase n=1 Tax=Massilia sp. H6 TaxID=2970464 RepID=UPI00216A9925|nr:CheR family methyltransferase [Massilia sp. H6]UVW27721.1 methyltransferase [Massilia sp. H6]
MSPRRLLQHATGLNLSEAEAERAMRERMAQLGVSDSRAYLRALGVGELNALTELVVVPESWLFRDAGAFRAATDFVQRRLAVQPARTLRILSLPCAGGEEPYSMAMALDMAGVEAASVRIDAIDLSHQSIARALTGHYTRNAFRGTELAFRDRYFSVRDGGYQLCDAMRSRIGFRQGNLFALDAASLGGQYDIVFCRNLLIYFDDPAAHAAAAVLRSLLADDGLLFTGYAEVPALCRHGFAALRIPGAFALEKETPDPVRPVPALRRAQAVRPAPARAPTPAARPGAAAPALDDLAQARRRADGGDYEGAAALCHALLARDPASAGAYFVLGLVSECRQQPAEAVAYWRRCVYLQPDHYEALCHLALLTRASGDTRSADAFQERAARIYGRRQADGGSA